MVFPPREIDVAIDLELAVDWAENGIFTAAREALRVALPKDSGGQVSLLLTDDATVQGLNRRYRGLDETTDVLSFSTTFPGQWEGETENQTPVGDVSGDFVMPPGETPPLGEVIISYPQAQRQAAEKGCRVREELALLVVHGILHLVGFDHGEPQEAAVMAAKEGLAMAAIFQEAAE